MRFLGPIVALLALSVCTLKADVSVRGYTKKDGTYVPPHHRSDPNKSKADNWSTKGNVNPYTGQVGTKPDAQPPAPSSSPSAEPKAARPGFTAITVGMMPEQVRALLGVPPVSTASVWSYPGQGYLEFSATGRVSIIRPGGVYVPQKPVVVTGGLGLSPSSSQAPPTASPRSSDVYVHQYMRSDGTVVQGHYRTAPNSTRNDNYSTRGNVNPYTGKAGTKPRDGETTPLRRTTKIQSAQPVQETPHRSHAELVDTVRRCNQLLDSYIRAPFGKSPFNAARYEEIRLEREEAQSELNAGL